MTYTLVTDGPSDVALLHPIQWLLENLGWHETSGQRAAELLMPRNGNTLAARISGAASQYPCDLMFIHRDAETASPEARREEIVQAAREAERIALYVCVVPVRMTEAWLLHDSAAIRMAAGNPNGTAQLALPAIERIEADPDPKKTLHSALLAAAEARGRRRRRRKRDFGAMCRRVAELIEDYSPLRRLSAFRQFEAALTRVLDQVDAAAVNTCGP